MAASRTGLLLTSAASLLLQASTATAQGPWGAGHGAPWDGNGGDGSDWNGNGQCWWQGNCNGSGNNNGNSNSNGSSSLGLSVNGGSTVKVITMHAVLASLVWVFLIPVGGILIRSGVKSPWIPRIHAVLQSLSYLLYIVAVGAGIWLIHELSYGPYNLWDDPHPKIGVAILVLAFFQPISGLIQHATYKRRAAAVKAGKATKLPGRTVAGYAHLWLGRGLIVLGMINGGLGLRLAARSPYETNKQAKAIAYGVGAGVMFLLYVAFVVSGEIRRSRARQEVRTAQQNVPLADRGDAVAPVHAPPPSYEDSQQSLRKQAETTARYS